ncbi:MAG: ribonuclease III [Bacteroidetes bacterium]|nr:ribonuclease III [Bacteroidota bacterium]
MVSFLNKTRAYFSDDKKLYRSLKNILGFYPKNIDLYKQAFRHRSACKDKKQSNNERLEFLGDAILSAVIGHYLFMRFPFKDEGFLTKMRSKLVSRTQLNLLAKKLGISAFIETNGDSGMRNSSVSGDAFEALIGAIYLDKGYKVANLFILKRVLSVHLDIDEIEQTETDFKSKFIEWAQKEKAPFEFRMREEVGNGPDKQFIIELVLNNEVKGMGRHFSKKRAEQMAAEEAMVLLEK